MCRIASGYVVERRRRGRRKTDKNREYRTVKGRVGRFAGADLPHAMTAALIRARSLALSPEPHESGGPPRSRIGNRKTPI